jgi:protein-disulfide isomerase
MKRFVKTALFAALLPCMTVTLTPAYAATNSANVSPAERAKIEEIVHQYLVTKPEVLVEAMQVLQNRQVEQAKQSVQKTQADAPKFANPLFHQANDPVVGNKDGKVTVVEFFDYQCQHCVDMAPIMDAVIKANPDVRIVFKEWPIRGPMSEFASRAALAANQQGKYLEFHSALFSVTPPLTQENILEAAKNAGLDVEKLKKDMNDKGISDQLKTTMKLAQDLKLFGTPAFFIGQSTGQKTGITYVPGEMNQKQLQEVIDKINK